MARASADWDLFKCDDCSSHQPFLSSRTEYGIAADRDARAYNGCLVRHPQDPLACDGPLEAYRVDASDPASAAAATAGGNAVVKMKPEAKLRTKSISAAEPAICHR